MTPPSPQVAATPVAHAPPEDPVAARRARLPAGLARAVGAWTASRLVLAALATIVRVQAGLTPASRWWEAPIATWTSWDTGWYLSIASGGYSAVVHTEPGVVGQASYAFWPLYPLLVRAVKLVSPGSWAAAGLFVAQVATIGAAWLLWDETARLRGRRDADATIAWFFLLPACPYLASALTESTFLFFSLAALVAARRGRLWFAGALAAAASATRATGVLLALPLAHEYLASRRWELARVRADALAIGFAAAGPLAFSWRVHALTGDPLAYVHVQSAWQRHASTPLHVVARALASGPFEDRVYARWALVVAVALLFGRRSVRRDERWFSWSHLLVPLASSISSTIRMSAVQWPLAAVVRDATNGRSRWLRLAVVAALVAAQVAVLRWMALEAVVSI